MFPFLFIFPGLFILFAPKSSIIDLDDTIKCTSAILFTSLAFWIFSYWITAYLPIKFSNLFIFLNIIFVLIFLIAAKKIGLPKISRPSRSDLTVAGLFILIILLRALPAFNRITGSVGDMTQHNNMTQIILANDGFSKTYEPLMPFSNFGEYPLGFHTLSAILTQNSDLPFYQATLCISVLAYILLHMALYCFLSRKFGKISSMTLSLFVLFLSHYPQFLNQWGSSTTALSTAFLFYGFYLLTELTTSDECSWMDQLSAAFVLSAGLLTHLIPPVGFIFYFSAWFLIRFMIYKDIRIDSFKKLIPSLTGALLLILPFIFNFNFGVFSSSKDTLTTGHINSVARITELVQFSNSGLQFMANTAMILTFLLGPTLSLILLGCLLWGRNNLIKGEFLAFILLFVILYACFHFQWIPFYHLLQVERIHYFILLPAAILIGQTLTQTKLIHKNILTALLLIILILIPVGGLFSKTHDFESHYSLYRKDRKILPFFLRDLTFGSYWAYAADTVNSGVTWGDLEAFEWIKMNTQPNAVFLVNYADGGHLIPSFTGRKITNPHGMDIWHSEDLKQWRQENPPLYIYIGQNPSRGYDTIFTKETIKQIEEKQILYESGGTSVIKIPY